MSSVTTDDYDDRPTESEDAKSARWDLAEDEEAREQEAIDRLRAHAE